MGAKKKPHLRAETTTDENSIEPLARQVIFELECLGDGLEMYLRDIDQILEEYSDCLSDSQREAVTNMRSWLFEASESIKRSVSEKEPCTTLFALYVVVGLFIQTIRRIMQDPATTGAKVRRAMKAGRESPERPYGERHKKWMAYLLEHPKLQMKSQRAQAQAINRHFGDPVSSIRKFLAKAYPRRSA